MLSALGMWSVMMCGMMAPAAWPWVRAFHVFSGRDHPRASRAAATALFAGGYGVAWIVYSCAAAIAHVTITRTTHAHEVLPHAVGALVLMGAGLFQFTSLKRACLTHCRSPFSYFLARWRNGPAGGFRMGLGHGLYCVACCWALMTTAFAVGVMNLWWMLALAIAVFAEQVAPHGARIRQLLGITLIIGGVARL